MPHFREGSFTIPVALADDVAVRMAWRPLLVGALVGLAIGAWMAANVGTCIVFSQDPEATCHRLLDRPISDETYRFLVVPSRGLLVGLAAGIVVATGRWAWRRLSEGDGS